MKFLFVIIVPMLFAAYLIHTMLDSATFTQFSSLLG